MTRINCVPVQWLSGKHLVAEYRELPRVFALSLAAQLRGDYVHEYDTLTYTMGRGHIKFFYTRLRWCVTRQLQLIAEMRRRGYHPMLDNPAELLRRHDHHWCAGWAPSPKDITVNLMRLVERDPAHYTDYYDNHRRAYVSTVEAGSVSV